MVMVEDPDNQMGLPATQIVEVTESQEGDVPPGQSLPPTPALQDGSEGLVETQVYGSPPQEPVPPEAATVSNRTPIEGMDWRDLQCKKKEWCQHCKCNVDVASTGRIQKKGHGKVTCRKCHNIVTLLYRRFDMSKLPGFASMTEEQATNFFKQAQQASSFGSDTLNFGKIRTLLTQTLTELEKHQTLTTVKGKFLPLSVWQAKGYDTEKIMASAEWQESALPFG